MAQTFAQYLLNVTVLKEDAAADVQRLEQEISAIDAQLAQRTAPLQRRKQQLTTLLAQKQEQLQAERKKAGETDGQNPNAMQQDAGNQTTTPGSSGSATPGSSATAGM